MFKRGALIVLIAALFVFSVQFVSAINVKAGNSIDIAWGYDISVVKGHSTLCGLEIIIFSPSGEVYETFSVGMAYGDRSGIVKYTVPAYSPVGTYRIAHIGDCADDAMIAQIRNSFSREVISGSNYFDVIPADTAPSGSAGGFAGTQINGWAQDSDCSGTVTPSYNGCPLDIHIYIDGIAGSGASVFGTVANIVDGSSNKDNYIWNIPSQYHDGISHTAHIYALGKDSSGNNNGNNVYIGSTQFTITPTCTSFTYNSWNSCSYGTQTRTVASSSPANCAGGSPSLSQSCTSGLGGACSNSTQCSTGYSCSSGTCKVSVGGDCIDTNQCVSGLYCKTSTGKCTDPNQEHYACSNNQCTLTAGAGSNTCTNWESCQSCTYSYSSWSVCSNGQQTRTVSASPIGCIPGTPITTQLCTSGLGGACSKDDHCNTASGLQCIGNICQYPTCTSFTYNAWNTCSNGQQTRTVASSSPSNCVGGSPSLSQSCTSGLGGACSNSTQCSTGYSCSSGTCKVSVGGDCTDTNQCVSGLYCKTSTGKCTDPNQEHYACSNNQCVITSGAGSNTCSLDVNCQACSSFDYTYGVCSNGHKTKTSSAGYPTGCSWTSSTVLEPCKGVEGNSCTDSDQCSANMKCYSGACTTNLCAGITCNSPPNNQCYTSAGSCSAGLCNYQQLPEGTACGTDQQCTSGGFCGTVQPITSVYWTNLKNNVISNADEYDFVKVNVEGSGISGRNVEFKLYRDEILDSLVETKTSNSGSAIFQINRTGTYYFQTTVESSPAPSIKSGDLIVESMDNSPPSLDIVSPLNSGIYFANSSVILSLTTEDVDDPIGSIIWSVGSSQIASGSYTTYSFTTEGKKTIKAKVMDQRGEYSEKSVEIFVVGLGIKVSPVIQTPKQSQAIINDSYAIYFNASNSYVLNITNSGTCSYKAECLAGLCPNKIENSPSCASGQIITITNNQAGYLNLEFNWTFKEGSKIVGAVKGKIDGNFVFGDYGTKNITLKLTYNPTKINSQSSSEVYLFNIRQCSSAGNTWSRIENGFVSRTYNTLNTGYCSGLDQDMGTEDDCCPVGFICSINGCVVDPEADMGCSSYKTVNSCNLDSAQRVKSDVLWSGKECGKIVDGVAIHCSCVWENSECKLKTNKINYDLSGTIMICSYSSEIGQCSNGYQTVNIVAVGDSASDPECANSNPVVPCGKPVVELSFFGMLQLLYSIVAVYFIYFIFSRFVSRK